LFSELFLETFLKSQVYSDDCLISIDPEWSDSKK